ncbi:hypothetical protein KIPB_008395 [Kipferlia bialata]|uniref:Alpha-type protein kinase domain-containing protein n=1 Tax=Kipferlia bialata TaxID=797122 RepID=A0A9K3D3B4_9EUKA|nr:hypothetical protein KIPB_008395 [Kipferlia bialata]|eukprot:g8395.t1
MPALEYRVFVTSDSIHVKDEEDSWHPVDSALSAHLSYAGSSAAPWGVGRRLSAEEKKERTVRLRKATRQTLRIAARSLQVDLVFLVDCTGSMDPWIAAVKESIHFIHRSLLDDNNQLQVDVAFVRYTDYDVGDNRTTVLPFTHHLASFQAFVGAITAKGGDDGPEDVLGGLRAVCGLHDRQGSTRILVHIADYPCHGGFFEPDSYPEGDRDGLTIPGAMRDIKNLDIQYHFGYITPHTKTMIEAFNADFVCCSTYPLVSASRTSYPDGAISPSVISALSVPLDPDVPDWGEDSEWGKTWRDCIVQIKRYILPHSLRECFADLGSLEMTTTEETLFLAMHPFERGGIRMCYRAYSPGLHKSYVVKVFQDVTKHSIEKPYLTDMLTQIVAARFAIEFQNIARERGLRIPCFKYCVASVVRIHAPDTEPHPMYAALESELDMKLGTWVNFNGNNGYVCSDTAYEPLQAFSDWSFVVSNRTHLVCDLQGLVLHGGWAITLSDPAIHHKDTLRFEGANNAEMGFQAFFKTHTCGATCKELGLEGNVYTN